MAAGAGDEDDEIQDGDGGDLEEAAHENPASASAPSTAAASTPAAAPTAPVAPDPAAEAAKEEAPVVMATHLDEYRFSFHAETMVRWLNVRNACSVEGSLALTAAYVETRSGKKWGPPVLCERCGEDDPDISDETPVRATWASGITWDIPNFTWGDLRQARASTMFKNREALWLSSSGEWKMIYLTDRCLLLSVQQKIASGWSQRLQLVVGHMTEEQLNRAIEGMKGIANLMAEGKLTKEEADERKIEFTVAQRTAAQKRPATTRKRPAAAAGPASSDGAAAGGEVDGATKGGDGAARDGD
eukprot:8825360-Pyramimonas_sp.AAC.1